VAKVLAGIRNTLGVDARQVDPLALGALAQLLEAIDTDTLQGLRDRALLLLGFAAALRRSELVALDAEDLHFGAERGLTIRVRKSKTDQQQAGALVAVPYARARDRCRRADHNILGLDRTTMGDQHACRCCRGVCAERSTRAARPATERHRSRHLDLAHGTRDRIAFELFFPDLPDRLVQWPKTNDHVPGICAER
jgi:hypothetical protein